MITAGIWANIIYCAAPGHTIKKEAIAIGHPGQGKGFCFGMEMLNLSLFHKSFSDMLYIILQLEFIHQIHSNKIRRLYLNRETAA